MKLQIWTMLNRAEVFGALLNPSFSNELHSINSKRVMEFWIFFQTKL